MYSITQIAEVLAARRVLPAPESAIEYLLTDSRKLVFPSATLFFALRTARRDATFFVEELYHRGVRNFVVSTDSILSFPEANIIYVNNPLEALQQLAAFHRQRFTSPVIGITGSNGKTMVKEWLYALLQQNFNIVRSPKSYNSQVGVPLSVWQMAPVHTLGIFEAGISQPGEMEKLEQIIRPTIGILTNIGEAHAEGFASAAEKAAEKLKLFKNAETLIYCTDCIAPLGQGAGAFDILFKSGIKTFSWSTLSNADLTIQQTNTADGHTIINAFYVRANKPVQITIPFTDKASIDNAITCWCVMLEMGYSQQEIAQRMTRLEPLEMRMQLKRGVNQCLLINDSYNNDLSSLELALDYLSQQAAGRKKTLILSDIYQSGLSDDRMCKAVEAKTRNRHVEQVILIGPVFCANKHRFVHGEEAEVVNKPLFTFFTSTAAFLQQVSTHHFKDETILLKGSRAFEFERIVHWLEEKVHQTVLEVNLNAMAHNLKTYQGLLQPETRLMAMVKAFSYGSGSVEIARLLQFHKVDYLAVAYADEGVELRRAGIHMPVMVMNPEVITFDALVAYNLEPELYSFSVLNAFNAYLMRQGITKYPVHIKLDTGMHRLGFELNDLPALIAALQQYDRIVVQSVFSHLAGSDDNTLDNFTQQQAQLFDNACGQLTNSLGYSFIRHLSNSAAITRHPQLQYDMVRLGIGLYGVHNTAKPYLPLEPVATLKTTVAQLRTVNAGESVGYSRKAIVQKDTLVATVRIGYADGYPRALGLGQGSMMVKGTLAPVVGNVCMDMTMLDVTNIAGVMEGDEVEVFGSSLPVEQVAAWGHTIAYEILTGISQRVKRVYFET